MANFISFQPSAHFNTKLYTGNYSTNAITGVGFQPDFTVLKQRDGADAWYNVDSVRGATETIYWDVFDMRCYDIERAKKYMLLFNII